MSGRNKGNIRILTALAALLLSSLACRFAAEKFDCFVNGGRWEKSFTVDKSYMCVGANPEFYEKYPDRYFSYDENQAEESPEASNGGSEAPPPEQDSTRLDPTSCLLPSNTYHLAIENLNDRTSSNGKHVCGADGMITNTGSQPLMYAVFRVNNYGAEETKYPDGKWLGAGYRIVEPGQTDEYGRFYRCTGPGCDGGEWYYVQRISILANAPGCIEYAMSFEDRPSESIVPIENPCSW